VNAARTAQGRMLTAEGCHAIGLKAATGLSAIVPPYGTTAGDQQSLL
jgi:hypothetical protein